MACRASARSGPYDAEQRPPTGAVFPSSKRITRFNVLYVYFLSCVARACRALFRRRPVGDRAPRTPPSQSGGHSSHYAFDSLEGWRRVQRRGAGQSQGSSLMTLLLAVALAFALLSLAVFMRRDGVVATLRRLFLTGRLDALYSALYQDLLTRGMVSLHGLVKQGDVAISENKVIMRRGMDKSWQMRTALLILQQGCQALRKERREKAHGNRPQIHTARMIARDKEIQARASREEEEFAYTPIDLANLGTDQENAGALAMPIGKKRLKPSRHIDNGNYKFTPIDLGNLESDEGECEEAPPKPRRKTTSLSLSQMKGYDKLFLP